MTAGFAFHSEPSQIQQQLTVSKSRPSPEFVEEHKDRESTLFPTKPSNYKIAPTTDEKPRSLFPSEAANSTITPSNTFLPLYQSHDSAYARLNNPRLAPSRNAAKASQSESPNRALQHYDNSLGPSRTANLSTALFPHTMGLSNNGVDERLQQESVSGKMDEDQSTIATGVSSGGHGRANEGKDHDEDSTTVHSIESSVPSPALSSSREPPMAEPHTMALMSITTTPSTVSTVPSSADDVSLLDSNHLDRLSLRMDGLEAFGLNRHRRVPSWESSCLQPPVSESTIHEPGTTMAPGSHNPPSNVWNNPQAHARIASFRNASGGDGSRYGFRPPEAATWQQHPNMHSPMQPIPDSKMYHHPASPYNAYQELPPTIQRSHGQLPPTPQRGGRGQRVPPSPHRHGHMHLGSAGSASSPSTSTPGSNSRSSAEVLKTLLRKKACLYEPDTSRAVALVTWLVGRELAMEFGFFSRQQLQAGVHACVADKIDSGVITRTKVNRCMQIILNSCFHYIIPRPDGSEENGGLFRLIFAREVTDDAPLLDELPAPWNDLSVSKDTVLVAATQIESPPPSPAIGSMGNPSKAGKDHDHRDDDGKKAVLLCFNENVRCAEDVFRCHNEFIRDTAHACHLQLSSQEWKHFFGAEAAGAPHLWGNIGIPIPSNELCDPGQVDALGMLAMVELTKFRTFWCSKRYEHDHELCGFAHIEVNGGWLRRNPSYHNYRPDMCPFVTRHADNRMVSKVLTINECPHGVNCEYAHSPEEVFFHPMRYKRRACTAMQRSHGVCHNGDACPDFHPMDAYRFPSKKIDGRAGSRHSRHSGAGKGTSSSSAGTPVLYVSPAPQSRFEDHLVLPGLQSLFRRQCAVVRAHIRHGGQCKCCYSYFGDDAGVAANNAGAHRIEPRGLPPVHRPVRLPKDEQ